MCRCGVDDETYVQLSSSMPTLSGSQKYTSKQCIRFIKFECGDPSDIHLTRILLYGSKVYNKIVNQLIIRETIRFIKSTGRFTILEAFPH